MREAAKEISQNLRRTADCILNKHRLVFLACADENSLASILEHSTKRLSALHEVTEDAPLPDSIFTCHAEVPLLLTVLWKKCV